MKRSVRAISIAAGLLILGITVAFAEPITFEYRGTVNWVQDDLGAYSKAPASVGDLVVFTYTFQSETPNTASLPWRGDYMNQGPLQATIYHEGLAAASWTVSSVGIIIRDNMPTDVSGYLGWDDAYDVSGYIPDPTEGLPFAIASRLYLLEHGVLYEPDEITSTSLPLIPPDPALFSSRGISFSRMAAIPSSGGSYSIIQDWYIGATIESGYTKVPEPGSLLLLGMGLAAVASIRSKKKKHA